MTLTEFYSASIRAAVGREFPFPFPHNAHIIPTESPLNPHRFPMGVLTGKTIPNPIPMATLTSIEMVWDLTILL